MINIQSLKLNLNERLKALKIERKEYTENKAQILKGLLCNREKMDHSKLIRDMRDIDREAEGLTGIISTSLNIAMSVMNPVKEKQKCIYNITNSIQLLNIHNEIKSLLNGIRNEKLKIENKIQLILKANDLIKVNPSVFEIYREDFLTESKDVLNYLSNLFAEMKNKLFSSIASDGKLNVKECNSLISEMDRTSILVYKLTNDTSGFELYFSIISEYVIRAITKNKIEEFSESILRNNQSEFKDILETLSRNFLVKIFLKVAQIINERKVLYFKEFNDYKIFTFLIQKILMNIESPIEKLIAIVIKISESIDKENNPQHVDLLCGEEIGIMCNFEKFRFFIYVLLEKVSLQAKTEDNISDFNETFLKFNTVLYDLGERYANSEINFMKIKLFSLFKEESLNFNHVLEKNLNSKYDELAGTTLNCIDDFFYILKISGARAVASLNLQLSLAIVNNIKSIILDDLFSLLDMKISAVLIKKERDIGLSGIKYTCKDDPGISYKFTFANLFLISCINAIDQSRNNIQLLFEELKSLLTSEILESKAFDHKEILLGLDSDSEQKLNERIKYHNNNVAELVVITFSDVDMVLQRYDAFLLKKIKLTFEYLYPNIKSSVDLINSVNYFIDGRSIQNVEVAYSFAGKFLDETDKILRQWKIQLSEGGFNKFLSIYAEYLSLYLEKSLLMKSYSAYGVIILEKDINKIVNYFQSKVTISIRENFDRLLSIVKVLSFESRDELVDYIRKYDDIKLNRNEIDSVRKLKK